MKKLLAILLTLAMLLSLAACGGSTEEDPNAGKYIGVSAALGGFSMPMSDIYPGETWIELKSGGKGAIMLDGDDFKLKWSLEGEDITVTVEGVDSVGTLKSGNIVIDLMNMGCVMTFELEGGSIADKIANMTTYNDAGYWELIRITGADADSTVSEEDMLLLKRMGMVMYLNLLPDGTGVLFMDEEMPVTWVDGTVTFTEDDMTINYTLEGDIMTLDMLESVLVFRKGFEPLPSEMEQAGYAEFMEVGVQYLFTTDANSATPVPTTGEAIITSYEIFDSAEGYPAKEGYEWRIVTMEATYFDDNARWYGIKLTTCSEDYYNTKLHDDSITEPDEDGFETSMVVYNGIPMETYERYTGAWSGWYDNEDGRRQNKLSAKYEYLMPKGYDGRVVGFVNSKNEWVKGSAYITDFDLADSILFRLN